MTSPTGVDEVVRRLRKHGALWAPAVEQWEAALACFIRDAEQASDLLTALEMERDVARAALDRLTNPDEALIDAMREAEPLIDNMLCRKLCRAIAAEARRG